nr:ketoreductase [Pseudogymnoascus verrucosus]
MDESSPKTAVNVVLGAIAFGNFDNIINHFNPFPTVESTIPILETFQAHGHTKVDTARIYGAGLSEDFLAKADWEKRGLSIETKLYPTKFRPLAPNNVAYSHNAADLRAGLLASLNALNASHIDTWYLYAPDRSTPFEETMREVNKLHEEGHFSRFGLCNYMSWEVAQIQEVCIKFGWIKPTVYQGIYNAVCRNIESELIPCLRHYGMSFEAAQPLASGLLTNAYRRDMADFEYEYGSRFNPDPKNFIAAHQRTRYWHDAYFDAIDIIHQAATECGLTEKECALRWLAHHSVLKKELGDAVVIGARSAKQLEENLVDLEKGPLPESVVHAMEDAGLKARSVTSSPYWH